MADILLELDIPGMAAMTDRLTQLAAMFPGQVGNALRAEAEIEMTEAKKRTPVWNPANRLPPGHVPGQLRDSGHVTGPEVAGDETTVKLNFGGPAAPYAIYVHEDMEAHHRTGQAKFLESVLLESVPYLAARCAERLQQGLGAAFQPTGAEVTSQNLAIDSLKGELGVE